MDSQRQLMMLLDAIAACEPCDQVPKVGGVDSSELPDLLVTAARSEWVNARTFMDDVSLPAGTILRLTKRGHEALRAAILRQDADLSETPQTSLAEKREKRALLMAHLYKLASANTQRVIDTSAVAESLGWNVATVKPVIRHLADRGLVQYVTPAGGISITAKGVDEAEEAMSAMSAGTDNLAGIRVTTGGTSGDVTVQIVQGDFARARIGAATHGRPLLPQLALDLAARGRTCRTIRQRRHIAEACRSQRCNDDANGEREPDHARTPHPGIRGQHERLTSVRKPPRRARRRQPPSPDPLRNEGLRRLLDPQRTPGHEQRHGAISDRNRALGSRLRRLRHDEQRGATRQHEHAQP
jgi:hypothetical protein